jgi:putative transposase
LRYVAYKNKKALASDLKPIYTAPTIESSERALKAFADKWDAHYPIISDLWKRNWEHVIPFLGYPPEIRRAIYTTNMIEGTNRQIRKVIKTKGAFPNDEAVFKIIFLALKNAQKLWKMTTREWKIALQQFSILFHDRFPQKGF